MHVKINFLIIFCLSTVLTNGKDFTGSHAPLSFIENKGQVTDQNYNLRPDIQFKVSAAPGLNIFIGNGAIHYQFSKSDHPIVETQCIASLPRAGKEIPKNTTCAMYRMDVELIGANKNAQVTTEQRQDYYENYPALAGHGEHGAVAHAFNKITYKDIYPHIDWVLNINNGQLEHEFVVNEGGNVTDIQLKYSGATGLRVNADGSLTATTPQGAITEQAPNTYQSDGKKVKSNFKLNDSILAFEADNYSGTLVIDPTLEWATYFGGGDGGGDGVKTDMAGNVYITGTTNNISGIATTGAYQTTLDGGGMGYNTDAFLAKFSSTGVMQWGTYYGGANDEDGWQIITDDSGNVYITGFTTSDSGIATPGAHQDSLSGLEDAFLAKFNSAGAILWATYYGGIGYTNGAGVTIDGSNNVYIIGTTTSSSGIATPGAYQTGYDDSGDVFLAKFNSSGVILWATYYGGSGVDNGLEVATDNLGNIYITGQTTSTTGISTLAAYQDVYGGAGHNNAGDAFLAKFNEAGNLQWATYYGGSGDEFGFDVVIDGSGGVYISGTTSSSSGIATPGAYQDVYGGPGFNDEGDAFLAKFNSLGAIQWATYFGGTGDDMGLGVVADGSGNVYFTGGTTSTSGIATPGAYDGAHLGYNDTYNAYLAKFTGAGAIQWATYYGGSGGEVANAMAIDTSRNVYILGWTDSKTGIATPGAYLDTFGDFIECSFLAKFNAAGDVAVNNLSLPAQGISIYPNPTQNEITISASVPIYNVEISNLLGQTVFCGTYNANKVTIAISQLPVGVYIVRVNDSKVYKVVRQ